MLEKRQIEGGERVMNDRKARWTRVQNKSIIGDCFACGWCGQTTTLLGDANMAFCPFCGAKMENVDDLIYSKNQMRTVSEATEENLMLEMRTKLETAKELLLDAAEYTVEITNSRHVPGQYRSDAAKANALIWHAIRELGFKYMDNKEERDK